MLVLFAILFTTIAPTKSDDVVEYINQIGKDNMQSNINTPAADVLSILKNYCENLTLEEYKAFLEKLDPDIFKKKFYGNLLLSQIMLIHYKRDKAELFDVIAIVANGEAEFQLYDILNYSKFAIRQLSQHIAKNPICHNNLPSSAFKFTVNGLDFKVLTDIRLRLLLNYGIDCLTPFITDLLIKDYPKDYILMLYKIFYELNAQISMKMKTYVIRIISDILFNYDNRRLRYVAYTVKSFTKHVFPLIHTIIQDKNVNEFTKTSLLLSVSGRKGFKQYEKEYITPLLQSKCPICMDTLTVFPKKAELKVTFTKCPAGVHVFHKHCLNKYIDHKSEYDCPVCRSKHPFLVQYKLFKNQVEILDN